VSDGLGLSRPDDVRIGCVQSDKSTDREEKEDKNDSDCQRRCEKTCNTYSDLDLIDRGPSTRLFCGLGGLDPKKGAKRASALAARCEYFWVGGGGGGGTGEREPVSDMAHTSMGGTRPVDRNG
jgi:hypothetical protein